MTKYTNFVKSFSKSNPGPKLFERAARAWRQRGGADAPPARGRLPPLIIPPRPLYTSLILLMGLSLNDARDMVQETLNQTGIPQAIISIVPSAPVIDGPTPYQLQISLPLNHPPVSDVTKEDLNIRLHNLIRAQGLEYPPRVGGSGRMRGLTIPPRDNKLYQKVILLKINRIQMENMIRGLLIELGIPNALISITPTAPPVAGPQLHLLEVSLPLNHPPVGSYVRNELVVKLNNLLLNF